MNDKKAKNNEVNRNGIQDLENNSRMAKKNNLIDVIGKIDDFIKKTSIINKRSRDLHLNLNENDDIPNHGM